MKFLTLASLAAAVLPLITQSVEGANNVTLSVLTHNVYFMSRYLYPNWGQIERAKLIGRADYVNNHDIIVLDEVWDMGPRDVLVDGLKQRYPHWTEVVGHTKETWDSTEGAYNSAWSLNGGVMIMSKWPMVERHQFIYKQGCGADWFALKGFAYAKIKYNGTFVHVFGTHLQANDPGCKSGEAAAVRRHQLGEMRQYIDNKKIPKNELVIMAGDFNVLRDSNEYKATLLDALQTYPPTAWTGHGSTWDPVENKIAHYNHPDGAPEYLDYLVVDRNHAKVESNVQNALKLKSPPYTLQGVVYDEYSDHYPIVNTIKAVL